MTDGATSAGSPKRPLSPHLQIWRFTVTMAASITHRGTGMVLYGGTALLALWLLLLVTNPAGFAAASAFVKSPLGIDHGRRAMSGR